LPGVTAKIHIADGDEGTGSFSILISPDIPDLKSCAPPLRRRDQNYCICHGPVIPLSSSPCIVSTFDEGGCADQKADLTKKLLGGEYEEILGCFAVTGFDRRL